MTDTLRKFEVTISYYLLARTEERVVFARHPGDAEEIARRVFKREHGEGAAIDSVKVKEL